MKFRFIALSVVLIVSAVLLRLFFALPFAQRLLRDQAAAQQLSIASYVAQDIDHSIKQRPLIAELVAALPPALLRQPGKLAFWIAERQRVNPLFNSGLLVVAPDGNGLLAQYPTVAARARLTFLNDAHSTAVHVAQQLLAALGTPFEIEGHTFTLGVSIGIALYDGDGISTSQLMSQADSAM